MEQLSPLLLSINYPENEESLIKSLSAFNDADASVLFIQNCPSTIDASRLVGQEWFRLNVFATVPSVLALRLKIDVELEPEFISKHKIENSEPILISYETTDGSQMIVYWKNKDADEFTKLELVSNAVDKSVNLFAVDFISDHLANGSPGESRDNFI
jgi:hypothetical protein